MLIRVLLVAVALLLTAPSAWAFGITITVTPERTITGPMITLGEIAEITGDDDVRIKALKGVRLGNAPRPGGSIVLSREMLGSRLAASGADFSGIAWNVPDNIKIITSGQIVEGSRIAEAALQELRKRISMTEDQLVIEPVGYAQDVEAPAGEIKLNAELPYGIRKSGPTVVIVSVLADGRTAERVSLRYNVKFYEDIVVATKQIGAHEPLTLDNLGYRRIETTRLADYETDIGKLIGLTAKRPIAPASVISNALLEKPVIVKRGSNITITARSGAMEVSAPGLALQDGAEGQLIRVQNTASKRTITAKVIAEGVVQVVIVK